MASSEKMESEKAPLDERLAHDPVYAHAKETVVGLFRNIGLSGEVHPFFRTNYDRYHSLTHQLRFLDACRQELTAWIGAHRPRCPYGIDTKCLFERIYATSIEIVRDELEVVNPAVAKRREAESFSGSEVAQVYALLNKMTDQLNTMDGSLNTLTTSSQFTYDDIIELLEDMKDKLPYGKKDWFDLLQVRFKNVALDEAIRASIVTPVLAKMGELIMTKIDPPYL